MIHQNGFTFGSGMREWGDGKAYSITFVVTEDCNLRCKYCYQVHKNNKMIMVFDVAKKAIDYILENPEIFNAKSVIWDFIGGEPLLELDLIDRICDYIKIKTYRMNHPWAYNYRISIGTNGILYGHKEMRKFIAKNHEKCNIGITIDGTKIKHDLQRVYKNGAGSYDDVVKNVPLWLEEFPNSTTKVTFSNADLIHLKDSIVHLWNMGMKNVPANIVFEDVWNDSDPLIYESQLRSLADYVLDNKLWNEVNCTLFDENLGQPYTEHSLNSNFCGSGRMLAIDAEGNLYPCIRFLGFSLENHEPVITGNIYDGLDTDRIRPFMGLTALSQSDKECIDCEVAQGCAWCQGNNYDSSTNGTLYFRPKFICEMHKARCRANEYYWGKLFKTTGLSRNKARENKKHLYFLMSDDSVEYCGYENKKSSKSIMNIEVLKKGLELAHNNFYKPIILNSKEQTNIIDIDSISMNDRVEIYKNGTQLPYDYYLGVEAFNVEDVERLHKTYETKNLKEDIRSNSLLNIHMKDLNKLDSCVNILMKKYKRININFLDINKTFDINLYKNKLYNICNKLIDYYKAGEYREIDSITDRLFLDAMDNCESGVNNFTLAPNGKVYACPAFYFNNEESYIVDLMKSSIITEQLEFKLENAPICQECDAYQCRRCIYFNKINTNEYNTPGASQCIKSHIERQISLHFLDMLKINNLDVRGFNSIDEIDYVDPIEKLLQKVDVNPYGKLC